MIFNSINSVTTPGTPADKITKNFEVAVYNSVDLLFYFFLSVMVLSFILAFFVYYSPVMIFFSFLLYIIGVFTSIILKYVYDSFFSNSFFSSAISNAPLLSFLLDHYVAFNVFWLSALLFFMYVSPVKILSRFSGGGGYY